MWFPADATGNFRRTSRAKVTARAGLRLPCLLGLLLSLLLGGTPAAAGEIYEHILTRPQWPQHANGHNILALPAVEQALRRFEENGKITIAIRYPGGDFGRQWADELYDWLVSFGVPTRHLELHPGSGAADRLVVSVIDRGAGNRLNHTE